MRYLYLLICLLGCYTLSAQSKDDSAGKEALEFKLHPNPALENVIYIETSDKSPKTIMIFDLFGKVVIERRTTTNSLTIDQLVPGVYMVQIRQKDLVATKKLVVR
ncbi:T9SS type A sorting domain-containing protein [Robiginitalea sp. IMCC44478]|uniref:T9SS type A sorting domain-containing protein n=1 Tax=Robiginitalea sp. IMCC44478 TaxID=3459122 RepID=UPI0040418B58